MYEPYQILGAILFGAIGLYLAVFYGSLLVAWAYGSFLHDGDKKIWSLPAWLDGKCDNHMFLTALVLGMVLPTIAALVSVLLVAITRDTGMFIPYMLMGIASAWAILYVMRAVIRLNKKLDKHEQDRNAHK